MLTVEKFEVKDLEAYRVIGKEIRHDMNSAKNEIAKLWDKYFEDGTLKALTDMTQSLILPDYVGWEGEYSQSTGEFTYIIGMLMKSGTPVPDGYQYRDLPASKAAVVWVRGSHNSGEIYAAGVNAALAETASKGHEFDIQAGYMIELYNEERFTQAYYKSNGEDVILDYYLPIKQ